VLDTLESCLAKKNSTINLFGEERLRSYKSVFFVETEENLDDFWLYMTTLGDGLKKGDVFGFISALYFFFQFIRSDDDISDEDKTIQFVIEEASELFFWTTSSPYLVYMTNSSNLFFNEFEYKSDGKLVTFKLYKYKTFEKEKIITKKRVYSFIPEEDLLKLQAIGEEMTLELLEVSEEHEFNRAIVIKMVHSIRAFVKIIGEYEETYLLSDMIEDFANILEAHLEDIVDFQFEDIVRFESFFENLNSWLLDSFFTGIESIDGYNSTIRESIDAISSILKEDEPSPTLLFKI
jgi:hypothetical protein